MNIRNEDTEITHEELSEFEFDEFSVFFVKDNSLWFLETHADDDELERIIIEDQEGMTYKHNEDFFNKVKFLEEDFQRLKKFMEGNK